MSVRTVLPLVLLVACESEPKKGITVGNAPVACDLSLDGLFAGEGTEWNLLEIQADKSEKPTQKARARFFMKDGKMMAKYNTGSISSMYDYACTKTEKEVQCAESPPHVKDWCQALLVADKECTPEALRDMDKNITDEEITKGIEEAKANYDKYKKAGGREWESFVFNNNNLGNKLHALLDARINEKKCNLTITDNYLTIYNGKKVRDSNPVGTNAFVKNDMGTLLWENCTDSTDMISTDFSEVPKKLDQIARTEKYGAGDTAHIWYFGEDAQKAPEGEGCSWSVDVWVDGKPVQKDLAPIDAEKRLQFYWSGTMDGSNRQPVVFFQRHKVCGGTKEQAEVACVTFQVL